ncbi:MAG: S1 RNA-binding domain-containing protein, partial [Planctomycetota bacterium]
MVNRNLIRNLEDDDILNELAILAPEEEAEDWLLDAIAAEQQDYAQGKIVDGKIVELNDEWALMDVGFKSEGTVGLDEWGPDEDPPKVGDTVKVLIEEMEDELGAADDPYGMIALSKRKAEKIIEWEAMMETVAEGQVVTGTVIRKIKGGLLVDIGVNVFLPGSQVDIRRPGDIGDFIGRVIQAEVLKIDDTRRNIVISRRS